MVSANRCGVRGFTGMSDAEQCGKRRYPSAELIAHTIRVWEPRLGRTLTEEDARQILESVVGYFRIIKKWTQDDLRTGKASTVAAEHRDIDK